MASSIQAYLHHDHIIWKSEVNQWSNDVELWNNELEKVEAQLNDLEFALKAHREALSAHGSAIQAREQAMNSHDTAIVSLDSGETGEVLPPIGHQRESERQAQQRSAHDRIRRHHHTVIANWSLLLKAIEQPM